jgi:hypothetical protein
MVIRLLDRDCYFQTVDRDEFNPHVKTERFANIINYRDFLWRITPKLKTEFHKDYQKVCHEYKNFYAQKTMVDSRAGKFRKAFEE